jgi:hypothetical protein
VEIRAERPDLHHVSDELRVSGERDRGRTERRARTTPKVRAGGVQIDFLLGVKW